MKQLTKAKARTAHTNGITVYFHPSKMRLDNPWTTPMPLESDADFDKAVNEFHYYNCTTETGLVVRYYIND